MRTKTRIQAFCALVCMLMAAAFTLIALVRCQPEPIRVEREYNDLQVSYARDGELCFAGVHFKTQANNYTAVLIPCDKMPINPSR